MAKTKRDYVVAIATKTGLIQSDVALILQKFLDLMQEDMAKGVRIEFRNFGVLQPVVRKARVGRNPKNPSLTVKIPAHCSVKFLPGKILGQKLSNAPVTAQ